MADLLPQFENKDIYGTTSQFVGSVGITAISIPTVATTAISEIMVRCPNQTPNSKRLLFSFDGGTTFQTLAPGEFIIWSLKGSLTQIQIKGNVATVDYEVLLNQEPN
jgi:hypothetical protein